MIGLKLKEDMNYFRQTANLAHCAMAWGLQKNLFVCFQIAEFSLSIGIRELPRGYRVATAPHPISIFKIYPEVENLSSDFRTACVMQHNIRSGVIKMLSLTATFRN